MEHFHFPNNNNTSLLRKYFVRKFLETESIASILNKI